MYNRQFYTASVAAASSFQNLLITLIRMKTKWDMAHVMVTTAKLIAYMETACL